MADHLTDILEEVWDDGNAVGLDGWIGPGRGAGDIDNEAVQARRRAVGKAQKSIRESRTITTVEQLDSLPSRSLVVDHGGAEVFRKLGRGWDCLDEDGSAGLLQASAIRLPALLLWQPKDEEADVTVMPAAQFDELAATLDEPGPPTRLAEVAHQPRKYTDEAEPEDLVAKLMESFVAAGMTWNEQACARTRRDEENDR